MTKLNAGVGSGVGRDEAALLCLDCATAAPVASQSQTACANCGSAFELERLTPMLATARHLATFGYLYRATFEDKGTDRKPLLFVDGIWPFVTLAVLSGLLGNTAHDTVKAVIRRIVDTWPSRPSPVALTKVEELLVNPAAFARFTQYVSDYLDGQPGVDPTIKSAIVEEVVVHEVAHELTDLMRQGRVLKQLMTGTHEPGSNDPLLVDIEAALTRAAATIKGQEQLATSSKSLFVDLWSKLAGSK